MKVSLILNRFLILCMFLNGSFAHAVHPAKPWPNKTDVVEQPDNGIWKNLPAIPKQAKQSLDTIAAEMAKIAATQKDSSESQGPFRSNLSMITENQNTLKQLEILAQLQVLKAAYGDESQFLVDAKYSSAAKDGLSKYDEFNYLSGRAMFFLSPLIFFGLTSRLITLFKNPSDIFNIILIPISVLPYYSFRKVHRYSLFKLEQRLPSSWQNKIRNRRAKKYARYFKRQLQFELKKQNLDESALNIRYRVESAEQASPVATLENKLRIDLSFMECEAVLTAENIQEAEQIQENLKRLVLKTSL